MQKKIYILEHLGCANCAAKIEKRILELPGVDEAIITFSTKQLHLTAKAPDSYLETIQEIARSYEPEIVVTERKRRGQGTTLGSHNHVHSGDCCHDEHTHDHMESCCGHTHDHCECSAHQQEEPDRNRQEPLAFHRLSDGKILLIGALFFLLGQFLPEGSLISLLLFIPAYVILGFRVLKTAVSNMTKGQIFDEHFLMSIATIGAFFIQEYPEAVGIMLFYRIGTYFEERAVEKSRSSIMEAVDLRPETVTVLRKEQTFVIPAEEAVPGDIIFLRAGDRIPLDGTIISGTTRIDTSAVTGEPVPVSAKPGDAVLSGCINQSGTIRLRVDKPLGESMVSRILEAVETAAANKPQMERFITRFSRIYTPFVVLTAALTAIVPSLITGNFTYWLYTGVTFLVISCPCALVLSVPLAFFSGIGAGSSKGILFKGGISLEAIKNIKTIVMDKTGTITKGTFGVQSIYTAQPDLSENALLSLAASCEQSSSHPIAAGIVESALKRQLSLSPVEFTEETAGKGICAYTEEDQIYLGTGEFLLAHGIPVSEQNDSSAGTIVHIGKNDRYLGFICLGDEIKSDSISAIQKLHKLGLHTVMLTGDTEENAAGICSKTGIKTFYSRLLPEDKLTIMNKIREKHGAVMFVGDGINDAPVLAGADVGAAMGNGADAAIEAADVVFMNQNLMSVADSIEISKAAAGTAFANIVFALVIKAFVLILGFFHAANIWFAVFADTGVALICVLNSIRVLYQYKK